MSCTVFKSTNSVDQSINVFPPKGYISNVRIVRNHDVENGDVIRLRNDNAKEFKAVGGTITCPSQGVTTPVTEITLGTVQDIFFKLDEGREFAYLAWKDTDRIIGVSNNDGSAFYGAIVDYSLGLHSENVVSINGICNYMGGFNQRVNSWDVSELRDAAYAFNGAVNFDREINWHAPKLQSMAFFLSEASKFNKNVTVKEAKPLSLSFAFGGASSFNSKINIDTSECVNFSGMFVDASKFNQPIDFNFSKATILNSFLERAKEFNQPIDFGNTPQLLGATYVFAESGMNSPIKFNAPNLQSVAGWFSKNNVFNKTITGSFKSVMDMSYMFFYATSFNQPINDWDIRNVLTFVGFLSSATSFNQDLSSWPAKFNVNANIEGVSVAPNWSTENYDKYLNALWLDVGTTRQNEWANGTSPKVLYATVKRSAASQAAVSGLIGAGWTILDGGLV